MAEMRPQATERDGVRGFVLCIVRETYDFAHRKAQQELPKNRVWLQLVVRQSSMNEAVVIVIVEVVANGLRNK